MNWLRLVSFLVLSLALSGYGFAKDHGGKGRDHDRDDVRHHDRDRHGDRDRDDRRIIISRHHTSRPPGWDHGRKVGWGNCNMPPGQAKKAGCHSTVHHHHTVVVRHDRDRDRDRRRRHTVASHTLPPRTSAGVQPAGTTTNPVRGPSDRDPNRPMRVNEVKQ
jgi:hypothetical protein